MITHKILCEICDHPLARAHLPNLRRPLVANMFEPVEAGYPFPFPDENMTWEWMKCPMCKVRPFIVSEEEASLAVEGKWPGPEKVKTDKGEYLISSHDYPGVPPQINIQIHDDAELEKEWKARSQPKEKPSSKSLEPQTKAAARKARRTKK